MQSLIAVGFRMGYPVTESLRMTLIELRESQINIETVNVLTIFCLWFKYYPDGKDVENFAERQMFALHLAPYGIRTFHPCLHLVLVPHLVKFLLYGVCEVGKQLLAFLLS